MEPIFFIPFFEEKPWGGDRLSKLYKKYPPGISIGESWELSSVTYRQTFVRNGEYTGTMLSELYKRHPEIFGTSTSYFPFVIKFIDAGRKLPLVVNGGGLKSDADQIEGNYVVQAVGPVSLVSGTNLKNNLELFNAIENNSLDNNLEYISVSDGDSFVIPPGLPHAIQSGALLYKIATPLLETSNVKDCGKYSGYDLDSMAITFRFEGHIEKFEQKEIEHGRTLIIDTERFCVEKIDSVVPVEENTDKTFVCYTSLAPGYIEKEGYKKSFRAGDTFIIPAGFGKYTLTGGLLLKAIPK